MSVLGPAFCWVHGRLAMYIVHLVGGDMAGDKNKPESGQSIPQPEGIYVRQAGKALVRRSHMNRNTKRNGVGTSGDRQSGSSMYGMCGLSSEPRTTLAHREGQYGDWGQGVQGGRTWSRGSLRKLGEVTL